MTDKPSRSIVHSWLAYEMAQGKNKSEAVRSLNKALGKLYTTSRLYNWLSGDREPERDTRLYMMSVCLTYVLTANGCGKCAEQLTRKQLAALAESLV